MKKITPIVLLILAFKSYAQKMQLPLKDSSIFYEGVVKLSDSTVSKNVLFSDALVWFVDTYYQPKIVLQLEDRKGGRLIGKGVQTFETNKPRLSYSIEVDLKKGKYRYRVYNLKMLDGLDTINVSHDYSLYLHDNLEEQQELFEGKKGIVKRYENKFATIDKFINTLILSLKIHMINKRSDDF
jgi:hypothetical protein